VIWHFVEVWFLLFVAFAVGCVLGAYLYGVLAESRLALAQGAVADRVGDVVDRMKASLGLSPDWRPHVGRAVERVPAHQAPPPAPAPTPKRPEPVEDVRYAEQVAEEVEEVVTYEAPALEPPPILRQRPPALPAPVEEIAPPIEEEAERFVPAGPVADDGVVPMRPAGLSRPRGGVPDNLTRIRGVGERNEAKLNSLGIYHFGQIAAWTPGEVRWIGQYLAFPERIERDDWVGQAMILASGGDTGFEKSADRRRRRRRERNQSVAAQQLAADVESIMGRRRSTPQSDADDANESDDD
jgi:predicted flap endonuclease-1-like 5' DNA nuclease